MRSPRHLLAAVPIPFETAALVLYEYPFNEGIRTMLRLEHLFGRLEQLIPRETPLDHHFALATVFEIMDVAARADLKADLLMELERHRSQFAAYRGNPQIEENMLDAVLARVDGAFDGLNRLSGKAGQALTSNEWLMSVRSRIGIPGGTCEFDLPAYHAWQQRPADLRRDDIGRWIETLAPLAEALAVLLGLLRDAGTPHRVVAAGGVFQQALPSGRSYHLMRVRLDGDDAVVPEMSGHRLMVSVRLQKCDEDGRLKPVAQDLPFELTLCS